MQMEALERVLQRGDVTDDSKLRLIMIFFISQPGVEQSHVDKLVLLFFFHQKRNIYIYILYIYIL
jgi:hypothetical protein